MFYTQHQIIRVSLLALLVKLVISPVSTGDYETATFSMINNICDAAILLTVLIFIPYTYNRFVLFHKTFIVLLVAFTLSTVIYTEQSAFTALVFHLKVYLPILFFAMLASYFDQEKEFAIKICRLIMVVTVLLIVIGVIILPDSNNRLNIWWPSYFGGLHTTSYAAVAVFFIAYSLYLCEKMTLIKLCFVGGVVFYSILLGWGVRTASLSIIIFFISVALNSLSINERKVLYIIFPVLILIVLFFIVFFLGTDSFDSLTSGRISMYEEKIIQLSENSLLSWFIGNGSGSDLIETDIWWWAAKGAHSDLITFLVEGGLVYFICTLFVMYKLYSNFERSNSRFIIIALLFTSTFSNGYLVRPLAAYLLFFSLALSFAMRTKKVDYER
ncbi:hypothetical protein [Vibrio owensii]|uniref:hypothetical protein n=1 Tax=Vibrio owensii TaxID=696485 RepID=UPI0018F23C65|nr:hypothetical protein [Vibrio owensii]